MNNDDQIDSAHGAFERYINDKIGADQLKHILIPSDQIDLASGPSYTGVSIRFSPDTLERLRNIDPEARIKIAAAMDKQLQQQAQELIDRAKSSLGVRTAFMMPSIDGMQLYEQLEQQLYDRLRLTYGDAFITEAEEFARTQGVSFASAVNALQLRDVVARSSEALRECFDRLRMFISSPEVQAVMLSITKTLAEATAHGMVQSTAPRSEPRNRRERRIAKHSKPMKDADQQWKLRDFRNHRKH